MAKNPRKSPGVGRDAGGSNISDDAILAALAEEVIMQGKLAEIRETRKRARKRAEANGVPLADLDALYKLRDDPISEVQAFFKRRLRVFSAFFTDLTTGQADFFAMPADAKGAFAHAGLMSGLKGDPASPPPNLSQDEMQTWLDSHHIGAEKRKAASDEILNEALARTDGGSTDGSKAAVTAKAAASVRDQAAADFEADQEAEGADQKEGGDPDFSEATPEELAGQGPRKALQEKAAAEAPEPEFDANASAKALLDKGFAKGSKAGGGKAKVATTGVAPKGRKAAVH